MYLFKLYIFFNGDFFLKFIDNEWFIVIFIVCFFYVVKFFNG